MKKMKRILALILCVCIVAACWPAEATRAEENATTSDISTYYLNNEKATVYTSNYFSTEEKYNSALGTYATNSSRITYAGLAGTTGTKNAVFEAVSLQNYSISADMSITSLTTNDNYGAVMAYSLSRGSSTANTYGYEFAIMGNKDGQQQTFRLYRRSSSNSKVLQTSNAEDCNHLITKYFPQYQPGTDKVTLTLSASTNAESVILECYATINGVTEHIFGENIVDSSANKITSGAPGLKSLREGITFYNVSVVNSDENQTGLYRDDFTSQAKYENALGNYKGATYQMQWTDAEGLDSVTNGSSPYNAIFNGLLQNYSVGADIVVTDGKTSGYAGVTTCFNGTTGYEFAIIATSQNKHQFRLYRRSSANATLGPAHLITTDFPNYTNGDKVTLHLDVSQNAQGNVVLNCYATIGTETQLIFGNVVDDSADKILSGAPGLKVSGDKVAFSNITVAIKTPDPSYVYKDGFSYAHSFDEALSEESFQYGNNYVLNDGKLSIPSGTDISTRISLLKGIDNYATLTNYTAEADFVFPAYDGESDIFNAIMVYGSGSGSTSTGYEFGIRKNIFRLFRRGNNETLCGDNDLNKVSAWFDNYEDGEEQAITLSLTAMTNTEKNGVTLICKATYKGEEKTIFTTTDTSANRITCGTAGLRGTTVNGTVDNFCVKSEEDIYDVSLYRNEEAKTYPSKEGKVFAGWYTNENFSKESALSKTATTGWAYAKFVDEDVLSVQAQLDGNTKAASESEKTRMRFVTTVDCLDYDEVGFIVSTTKKTETYKSTTVYSTLLAQGLEVPYKPEDISPDSEYFATMILGGLSATEADLSKVFTVTPFWVTADGTTVNGITRDAENNPITIQAGIDANNKNSNSSSPYSLR